MEMSTVYIECFLPTKALFPTQLMGVLKVHQQNQNANVITTT
jgi:hypothetical protein